MASEISHFSPFPETEKTDPQLIRERFNALLATIKRGEPIPRYSKKKVITRPRRYPEGYWTQTKSYTNLYYHESYGKLEIRYFQTIIRTNWEFIESLAKLSECDMNKEVRGLLKEINFEKNKNKKHALNCFARSVRLGHVKRGDTNGF